MMTRRTLTIFVLLTAILAAVSCKKEQLTEDGLGGIILSLNSQHALRMETKGTLLDGSLFNNVLVILTDDSDNIVGKVYKDHTGDPKDEDLITFRALLPGNYHAYAYANIDATQWQKGDARISSQESIATGSFSTYLNRELLTLTTAGTDAPANPDGSMLLTGKQDISVGLSVTEKTIDLLRPVVRFKVTVHNNTPFPVTVNSLSFSKFNPDKAYLLDHRNASGVPTVPAGVIYRELPAFVQSPSSTVAAGQEETVYTTYLYENVAQEAYKVFTSLSLDRSSEFLEDLFIPGFGVIDYTTLNSMGEGDEIDVLFINPRSATRSGRLYYGIGSANKLAWESCGYSSFSDMVDRARAIFEEDDNFKYKGFSYTGFGDNKSGLLGWTGNTGDAPFTPPAGDYFFDYSSAKSTYFKTIRKYKSGEVFYYSIDGLAENPNSTEAIIPGDTSIEDIQIEQGKKMGKTDRYPSGITDGNLIRFKNTDGYYLKSNNAWGAGNIDVAKECKLFFEDIASNNTTSDHQFVLFGQTKPLGHPLKRILKENNKEVLLTYMARNEDINVIINVFYSNQEGTLEFVVDNSHWDDEHATTSSHTFN